MQDRGLAFADVEAGELPQLVGVERPAGDRECSRTRSAPDSLGLEPDLVDREARAR